ncbi:hypothetical protein NECID01_0995 [Nematocida sp. AWRm77]|nr:hypothetical protein NECID01_0995 [Nematocida sp. AWRm77]
MLKSLKYMLRSLKDMFGVNTVPEFWNANIELMLESLKDRMGKINHLGGETTKPRTLTKEVRFQKECAKIDGIKKDVHIRIEEIRSCILDKAIEEGYFTPLSEHPEDKIENDIKLSFLYRYIYLYASAHSSFLNVPNVQSEIKKMRIFDNLNALYNELSVMEGQIKNGWSKTMDPKYKRLMNSNASIYGVDKEKPMRCMLEWKIAMRKKMGDLIKKTGKQVVEIGPDSLEDQVMLDLHQNDVLGDMYLKQRHTPQMLYYAYLNNLICLHKLESHIKRNEILSCSEREILSLVKKLKQHDEEHQYAIYHMHNIIRNRLFSTQKVEDRGLFWTTAKTKIASIYDMYVYECTLKELITKVDKLDDFFAIDKDSQKLRFITMDDLGMSKKIQPLNITLYWHFWVTLCFLSHVFMWGVFLPSYVHIVMDAFDYKGYSILYFIFKAVFMWIFFLIETCFTYPGVKYATDPHHATIMAVNLYVFEFGLLTMCAILIAGYYHYTFTIDSIPSIPAWSSLMAYTKEKLVLYTTMLCFFGIRCCCCLYKLFVTLQKKKLSLVSIKAIKMYFEEVNWCIASFAFSTVLFLNMFFTKERDVVDYVNYARYLSLSSENTLRIANESLGISF